MGVAADTPVPEPAVVPPVLAEALEAEGREEQIWQEEQSWNGELAATWRRMTTDPLRVLEVGLGLMLVLLAAATVLLMVQRRRA